MSASLPFRLVRPTETSRPAPRLAKRFARVGLRGVLADLNRRGRRVEVPGEAAAGGFRWDERDVMTPRWWPQGITTSADAYGPDPQSGTFEGRGIVLVSWYARGLVGRLGLGSRITVVDGVDDDRPRYRHVLLVEPVRWRGLRFLRPVRVHAGGIVWYGDHLFVAGSSWGIRVFRLDELARAPRRWGVRGHRYVLPQHTSFRATTEPGHRPMTYSFMSLDRSGEVDHLVAGEYGRAGGSHRLLRYALDRETHLLAGHPAAAPLEAHTAVARMQGTALVEGRWVMTASAGEGNPGDLWVGRPGALERRRGVLPTGPEDITWWPQRRELWTLTEWPDRRWVYAIDADAWIRPGAGGAS